MNIIIADTAIRQSQSLYSLNDLHKAAGNEQRHKPANWLALQQVSELIAELGDAGNPASKENQQIIQVVKGGKNQGTFVCKELVYAYATWISPAFFLKVIRTFDAVTNGQPETPRQTTPDERAGLRQAVTMLTTKRGLMHDEAYRLVHQRFNVAHIEEIPAEQLPLAVEYVHRLAIGELLPKDPKPKEPETPEYIVMLPIDTRHNTRFEIEVLNGLVARYYPQRVAHAEDYGKPWGTLLKARW